MKIADIEGSEHCDHCRTGSIAPRAGGRYFKLRAYVVLQPILAPREIWLHDHCIPDYLNDNKPGAIKDESASC